MALLCFYSKTGFWPSYCQISTDLDKILHTPIVVWNTLVGRLRPRSKRGRLQAKSERLYFCNLVTHPKSYRDDMVAISPAKRQSGGEDGYYREKIWNFLAWAEPDPKTAFFSRFRVPSTVLRTAYRKQFYPKPMVPMESRDSRCAFC